MQLRSPMINAHDSSLFCPVSIPDSLSGQRKEQSDPRPPPPRADWQSPVYAIIAINVLVHLALLAAQSLSSAPTGVTALSLSLHLHPKSFHWWQVLTSGLVHTDWAHLAETSFHTYLWGRLVEQKRGAIGVLVTYVASLCGANVIAWLTLSAKAGKATVASPATWLGLFAVGIFWPRINRKPLELLCLTPLVLMSAVERFRSLAPIILFNGWQMGHLVHPMGALVTASLLEGTFCLLDAARAWLAYIEEQKRKKAREDGRSR
ncbi:hypothetical protein DUNSADRAFT_2329 [Dunaliella salina]|uniref:Peptidase S54 rhomboid domain-containing protein n=1 Tax=Dunaliella salina TaxID=3046 RepID=A0ABQ7GVR7_DUNSA|nr:hypothetical protein DUNSADRAFT_2329 [Dunaliella salina]|eukprot:KAF5838704.1 hypothetical protein DUNSADRAFT_2329 [Dunaliella salina]